jgi:TolA-binding protein
MIGSNTMGTEYFDNAITGCQQQIQTAYGQIQQLESQKEEYAALKTKVTTFRGDFQLFKTRAASPLGRITSRSGRGAGGGISVTPHLASIFDKIESAISGSPYAQADSSLSDVISELMQKIIQIEQQIEQLRQQISNLNGQVASLSQQKANYIAEQQRLAEQERQRQIQAAQEAERQRQAAARQAASQRQQAAIQQPVQKPSPAPNKKAAAKDKQKKEKGPKEKEVSMRYGNGQD